MPRRRDCLFAGSALASLLVRRDGGAQSGTAGSRAAVVIGVDKAGALPKLSAAATGAQEVATWLGAEGFEVRRFVDSAAPVRVHEIADHLESLVERGTLEQLVVYFAGHGYLNGYNENWLLSKAPDNANEAISLVESFELARRSGIPSIVLISDACRSRADSLRAERVRGSLIFPNKGASGRVRPEIDRFLATMPGDPALEVVVDESARNYEGIFTATLREAYLHPDEAMLREVDGTMVVPNRNLKDFLRRETRRRAESRSLRFTQEPESIIESGDTVYIARAIVPPPPPGPLGPVSTPVTQPGVTDVVRRELQRVGAPTLRQSRSGAAADVLDKAAWDMGFLPARDTILATLARPLPELGNAGGLAVYGTRLELALAGGGAEARINGRGDGRERPELVRLERPSVGRGASIALQFADGGGTILAALQGYVGSVIVEEGRVTSVTYLPAPSLGQRDEDLQRVAELQAVVATAARYGAFRIDGERARRAESASQLANRIRVLKSIDPTLGIYAAYAYGDADLLDQVRSVQSFMRGDLDYDIFDVALLAGSLSGRGPMFERVVPFCPMLSQGWSLLRVRDVRLAEEVEAARPFLRQALWTSFEPAGMRFLLEGMRRGRLR